MKTEFVSPDIHCQKCAGRVRDALGKHAGVRGVEVDPPTHKVVIDFDDAATTPQKLREVLAEAGYPPN